MHRMLAKESVTIIIDHTLGLVFIQITYAKC